MLIVYGMIFILFDLKIYPPNVKIQCGKYRGLFLWFLNGKFDQIDLFYFVVHALKNRLSRLLFTFSNLRRKIVPIKRRIKFIVGSWRSICERYFSYACEIYVIFIFKRLKLEITKWVRSIFFTYNLIITSNIWAWLYIREIYK